MTVEERDRNTALAVARGRARRGDEPGALRWVRVAEGFASPTKRQRQGIAAAIAAGGAVLIPGQLDLDGREHR